MTSEFDGSSDPITTDLSDTGDAAPEDATTVLTGGPFDGSLLALEPHEAMYETRSDGVLHRYIRTSTTREVSGRDLTVFTYDGETYESSPSPQPEQPSAQPSAQPEQPLSQPSPQPEQPLSQPSAQPEPPD